MIAVDTNILVYAHREDSPQHQAALEALTSLVEGHRPWAVPWPCLHEFFAIVTHPRVYRPPTDAETAVRAMSDLVNARGVVLLTETAEHGRILAELIADGNAVGPKVHDARIAAICLGHGVEVLWTADRDFSYFPRLATRNPLVR